MRITVISASVLALALAGGAASAESAKAPLATPGGEAAGTVTLTQHPSGVLIQAELENIAPGVHGFHIHETGACAPDFTAAGGHFAPEGEGHGFSTEDGPHAGDLPNVTVAADGTATVEFWNTRIALTEGASSLMDDDGAAIIVHENPDSYLADAGAGGRVACGVIEPAG